MNYMDKQDLMMVLNSFEEFYKDMIERGSHVCAILDFENEAGWLDIEDKKAFEGVYGLAPLKRNSGNLNIDLDRELYREGYIELDSGLIVPNNVARVLNAERKFYMPPTRRMINAIQIV